MLSLFQSHTAVFYDRLVGVGEGAETLVYGLHWWSLVHLHCLVVS